ncbi:MAG TPA: alpha/beta hydrolase, partial [Variovorax sp.]
LWYQYYFHSERGRAGLAEDRRGMARLLWRLWSPTWAFDDASFERTAAAFDHPDFVEVVIHSYRHRFGLVPGDPACADIEARLAAQPPVTVPALTLDGADDGVRPPADARLSASQFTGPRTHRIVPGVGHNLPQEAPRAFADAVLEIQRAAQP